MSLGGINESFKPGDAIFFSGAPWYGSAPQCDSYEKAVVGRKNQNKMTDTEWQNFKQAIKDLKAAPESDSSPNFQQIVQCHIDAMRTPAGQKWGAHGGINFLTWHRAYLQHFEARLRSFNSAVFLPYWDWIVDRAIPKQLGKTSEWGVTRRSNPNFSGVAKTKDLENLLKKTTFIEFSEAVENAPFHNSVHGVVGGDMVSAASPSDPLFWLHHCFIDKLFANWQRMHGNIKHPNMGEVLLPPPIITKTNGQVWSFLNLGYNYI
ncbi:MAG: hypothetical protein DWQ05_08480 [Calditrichaeota bacterium]|nr:MAG: hypothetical protein DWQ05_08480 [Calditrichota bacterium]